MPQKQVATRLLIWIRRLIVLLIVSISFASACWFSFHEWLIPHLDNKLLTLREYKPPVICNILDKDGEVIDVLYDERRIWVSLDEISLPMQHAVLAAEDRRFFEHPGFDRRAMIRALFANVEAGRYAQGASTLTQQLVKHIVVGRQRTLGRKLEELLLSWRLEQTMEKSAILELYLNYVYLGEGNYGVEAAALDYFNKRAADLEVQEAALIAGLIPSPSTTSPRKSYWGALQRREIVLSSMVEAGYINPIHLHYPEPNYTIPQRETPPKNRVGDAYRSEVRRTLSALAPRKALFENGLEIHTAYNPEIQAAVEQALSTGLEVIEARQGHGGAFKVLNDKSWQAFFDQAPGIRRNPVNGEALDPQPGDCLPAAFREDKAEEIWAGPFALPLSKQAQGQQIASRKPKEKSGSLRQRSRAGQVYNICLNARGQAELAAYPWAQGAVAVLHTATGNVVALSGGTQMPLAGFNRATQALRQPGSAFKPIVYAAALEAGKNQLSRVLDGPLVLKSGGETWSPKNYDRWYRGWVSFRSALSQSLNTAAVRVGQQVGMEEVLELSQQLGIKTPLRGDATLPLGSSELTLLELTQAYATLARQGQHKEAVFVTHVVDRLEQSLGDAGDIVDIGGTTRLPGGRGKPVLLPSTAYQILDMMQEVVRSGTARKAYKPGYARAGKTGTSSDYADAWFVGMTPKYTVGVWVGSDQRRSLGPKESGGKAALPIWLDIIEELEEEKPQSFDVPTSIRHIWYDDQKVAVPRRR